ncbi:MAG TPA: hypothetical protein VE999_22430 [Gemmataceae bacterium]|nr:hypothetical protein [Gemmataceae bacterium]
MQKIVAVTLIALTAALAFPRALQADPIQSGPQVGDKVPGAFAPLNITGPNAGQKFCQYCKNGSRPVAVVFAKEVTPAVVQLVKTIDRATAMNRDKGLGSYVVFCSDADGIGRQLQAMAQKEGIQNTVVTLYKAGGPEKYRLSPAADVTVLLYHHFTVKANHAFKNGDLTEAAVGAIGADIAKLMAE